MRLSGGWAVFWNELLNGAPPNRHRSVANAVTHIGRAMTAKGGTGKLVQDVTGMNLRVRRGHTIRSSNARSPWPARVNPSMLKRLRNSATVFSTTRSCPRFSTGCAIRSANRIGTLHHLESPSDFDVCADSLGANAQYSPRLRGRDVQRFDGAWLLTPRQLYLDTHPIRQGRGHDPVQHCSSDQGITFESKIFQPGPPKGELIHLLQGVPNSLRMLREVIAVLVVDDRSTKHVSSRVRSGRLGRPVRSLDARPWASTVSCVCRPHISLRSRKPKGSLSLTFASATPSHGLTRSSNGTRVMAHLQRPSRSCVRTLGGGGFEPPSSGAAIGLLRAQPTSGCRGWHFCRRAVPPRNQRKFPQ